MTLQIGALNLKNRLIMAPMAGITNLPFRLIVKKLGAGLVTTEMVNAMGLTLGSKKTCDYLKSTLMKGPFVSRYSAISRMLWLRPQRSP